MESTEQKKFTDYVKEFEGKFRNALSDADKVARETMSNLVPAETATHLSNCKRELLLAVRSVIDRELESAPKAGAPSSPPDSTTTPTNNKAAE